MLALKRPDEFFVLTLSTNGGSGRHGRSHLNIPPLLNTLILLFTASKRRRCGLFDNEREQDAVHPSEDSLRLSELLLPANRE